MKQLLITRLLFIVFLLLVSIVYADEAIGTGGYTETWTNSNYTLTIVETGTDVTITGIPFDEELHFPLKFTGTVSDNRTRLLTSKIMTGTQEIQISDDQMEISGIQTFDPVEPSGTSSRYTFNATRNGTRVIPDAIWTGEWLGSSTSMTLYQTGNAISGFYYAISEPEPRVDVEGFVSDDGKNLSLNWTFEENVNFTRSDDGMHLIEEACGEEEIANGDFCLNLTRQI